MKMIGFNTWHEGLDPEAVTRAMAKRASWDYPPGASVAAEYWTAGNDLSNPVVVVVYDELTSEAMLQLMLEWGEYFEMKFVPAMTGEEGLEAGGRIMQQLGAPA